MTLLTMMWKDVQGCMKELHFYQNKYSSREKKKKKFTTSPQVFQYLQLFKLNFQNSKTFSKSAAHWSRISLNTVKWSALMIILLSLCWL